MGLASLSGAWLLWSAWSVNRKIKSCLGTTCASHGTFGDAPQSVASAGVALLGMTGLQAPSGSWQLQCTQGRDVPGEREVPGFFFC